VKIKTKYYLNMKYLPYFNSNMAGVGVCDIDKMVELVLAHPDIAATVAADEANLPRNF
jgi:hypothetical protein